MSGARAAEVVGEWSVPLNFPSLLGVHLAVNAISDAFVLVDGPDCSLYKAHFIHGRHDWNSTLLDVSGRHRVAFTNVCSRGVVKQHDAVIAEQLKRLDALPEAGLLLATALPMCSITGVDYGRVIRGTPGLTKPAVDIPPGSLVGDWLDGYAQCLAAAASLIVPSGSPPRRNSVAIVGYLRDRNEGDHRGNVEELRRLCAALDLELACVFPGGEPFAALRAAAEAEFVVSLPYGRKAARLLAEKSGAALVEAEVPFGLPRTQAFLDALAKAAGREEKARAFHEAQLRRVAPRLEWILPHVFLNKRAVFVGDPHLAGGFLDVAEDAGMRVGAAVICGREAHGGARAGVSVLHEPPERSERVRGLLADADIVVSCYREMLAGDEGRGAPVMEFGFPSYRHHVLLERPFLGYDGFLAFLERMAEHLLSGRRRWDG